MDDEIHGAIEDFEEALVQEGGAEALRTLQSYAVELHGASPEALASLLSIFSAYFETASTSEHAINWAECAELKNFLTSLLYSSSVALASALQASWETALGSILINKNHARLDNHLARVLEVQAWLQEAIQGVSALLQSNSYSPCNDYARRSLIQTSIYSLSLFPYNATIERGLEELLEASMVGLSHHRATLVHLVPIMQGAFEAAIDTIQTDAAVHAVSQLTIEDQDRYYSRCWTYLTVLQRHWPHAGDAWWGTFGSALLQLSAALKEHRGTHPALTAACKFLCHKDSASMLLQYLLANPACAAEGAKGVKAAFQAAQTLLRGQPGALISACCELLNPATNVALAIRVEALQTIIAVQQRYGADDASLWERNAASNLFFALSRDPSVRVHRKAMDALLQICKHLPMTLELEIITAVLQRCIDQDPDVRKAAYTCLETISSTKLVEIMSKEQWRQVLEDGFGAASEHGQGHPIAAAGQGLSKQAREIQAASKRMLAKYIRQDGEEVAGAAVKRLHELMSACSGGSGRTDASVLGAGLLAALSGVFTENDLLQA